MFSVSYGSKYESNFVAIIYTAPIKSSKSLDSAQLFYKIKTLNDLNELEPKMIKRNLKRAIKVSYTLFLLSISSQSSATDSPNIKIFSTANDQIYQAQQLLNETKGGHEAYELLRDLIKNDETINDVSMSKIEDAADKIRNFHHKRFLTTPINSLRYQQRPYLEARFLLAEAIMDSRIDFNESSDTGIKFLENLLKNYFYPGHPDKVTIFYPSDAEFAFDTWALTRNNILKAKTGLSSEHVDSDDANGGFSNSKMIDGNDLQITEEDILAMLGSAIKVGVDYVLLKENYDNLNNRVKNGHLEKAMLLQAIADPQSVKLDPQLKQFIDKIRVKIDLGDTASISENEKQAYQEALGEDIFSNSNDRTSIDLTKLYGLNRNGTSSSLKLLVNKQKSKGDRTTLSIVSSIAGEDLMFTRFLQSAAATLRNGQTIVNSKGVVKTVQTVDRLFDYFASLSGQLSASAGKMNEVSNYGRSLQSLKFGGAWFIERPSKIYDWIAAVSKDTVGKKFLNAINNNGFIKNGHALKWFAGLAVVAELVTATIEYQYLESKKEKGELIAETGARLSATGTYALPLLGKLAMFSGAQFTTMRTYFIPYVGAAAAVVDISHFLFGTKWETADVYRAVGYLSGKATLYYYGFNHTTLALTNLEFKYDIPRHDVKIKLLGSNIQSKAEALERQGLLFKEMENITLSNLLVIYRAHRELDRGPNKALGRKIHGYNDQYRSNLKTYREIHEDIQNKIESYSVE